VTGGGRFDLLSRETFLLGNNLLLVVIAALILLGTLFPLIYEALDLGKISVGFPWFNTMFVAFMPFLVVLMGIGPLARWKHNEAGELLRRVRLVLVFSLVIGVLFVILLHTIASLWVGLGCALAAWLVGSLLLSVYERLRKKDSLTDAWRDMTGTGRSYFGMVLAHLGMAIAIVGVTFVSTFDVEKDVRVSPGQRIEVAGHTFLFEGVSEQPGPNYSASQGTLRVFKDGAQIALLKPEKRSYLVQTKPMTEAAIDVGMTRDLYVSLGEPLGGGDWSLRIYYKPFVRWIWLGGIFMVLGGVLAISDRRYRMKLRRQRTEPVVSPKEQLANEGNV
jgi:cytochrome c-type biogenesis protein CcmF